MMTYHHLHMSYASRDQDRQDVLMSVVVLVVVAVMFKLLHLADICILTSAF